MKSWIGNRNPSERLYNKVKYPFQKSDLSRYSQTPISHSGIAVGSVNICKGIKVIFKLYTKIGYAVGPTEIISKIYMLTRKSVAWSLL